MILAPAKLNLCLYLGRLRGDGLHELCSLFEPLSLADEIEVAPARRDEVICPRVDGENLAWKALRALREAGWDAPPVQVRIHKKIPVAAGLGGGSADAAAVLRLADGEIEDLAALGQAIGADVPSQVEPAFSLVQGAGEVVEPLAPPAPHAALLLPGGGGLATGDVFAEADRLGLGRPPAELERLRDELREAASGGASPLEYPHLLVNDLEPAAVGLRPEIAEALQQLRDAAAPVVLMSGSGPTACGLFAREDEARAAAARLGRDDAIVCLAGGAA